MANQDRGRKSRPFDGHHGGESTVRSFATCCISAHLVLDDGSSTTGEVIRLRKDAITFGRTDGDITFPPDSLMSSCYCRIHLKQIAERQWTWTLGHLKWVRLQLETETGPIIFDLLEGNDRLGKAPISMKHPDLKQTLDEIEQLFRELSEVESDEDLYKLDRDGHALLDQLEEIS